MGIVNRAINASTPGSSTQISSEPGLKEATVHGFHVALQYNYTWKLCQVS